MKKWLRVLAIVATATASSSCAASADGPPEIIVDHTTCAHCGMFVSEPAFAAAYRTVGGEARVFDDIGCLLDAVKKEREPRQARFWFHDLQSAEWIAGEAATFVRTAHLHTPMGGSLMAYRDKRQAEDAVSRYHGQVIGGLPELLAQHGGTR